MNVILSLADHVCVSLVKPEECDLLLVPTSVGRGHIFLAEVLCTLSGRFLPAKYAKLNTF